MPTSSMSGVRKDFCTVVSSGAGGCSRPRKKGINGCIPAVVSRVERSSARGISEAEGLNLWPFDSKKARKPARSSAEVRILRLYEWGPADPLETHVRRLAGIVAREYAQRNFRADVGGLR